jgi:hypothetical protein
LIPQRYDTSANLSFEAITMRKLLFLLFLLAPVPAIAQQNVVIVGRQADGTVKPVDVTSDGKLLLSLAGHSACHISTATTTTCKSGAGVLHTLSVNNLGTVASLTVVYDNTAGSGTVLASINTLAGQTSYLYDVAFTTGLTVVTTGTVSPDITISYR